MKRSVLFLFILIAALLFSSFIVTKTYASDFSDTFTDTNGVELTAHNSQWVYNGDGTHNDDCHIEGNQLNDTSTNDCFYYVNDTYTDGNISEDAIYSPGWVALTQRSGADGVILQMANSGDDGSALLVLDAAGATEQTYNFPAGTFTDGQSIPLEIDDSGTTVTAKVNGTTYLTATTISTSGHPGLWLTDGGGGPTTVDNYTFTDTSVPAINISASPATGSQAVGTPFNVAVQVNSDSDHAFNAAQATVTLSSNLSVTGIHNATSNSCGFQYTKHPTPSDPSFAGAIFGGSSTGCTAYTMTITPTTTGTGTVTFINASMKAYSDSSEILSGVQNGSFTIGDGPTPTPTSGVPQLTITSPLETYYLGDSYTLAGGKDTSITHVFVNGSESGVTFPTDTTWQVPETLAALGTGNTPSDNFFTIYGSDGTSNTASQTVDVSRHTLGDINGDGVVDLTDASLFAVDFGKTSNLTYALSDMNGGGNADLTDLSILAKLEE